MGCCGRRREQIAALSMPAGVTVNSPSRVERPQLFAGIATPPAMSSTTGAQGASAQFVRLRYLGQAAIRVHGAATGRSYIFSGAQPLQQIDVRDTPGFLRLRAFARGDGSHRTERK